MLQLQLFLLQEIALYKRTWQRPRAGVFLFDSSLQDT